MAYQREFGASPQQRSLANRSVSESGSFVMSDHSRNNQLTPTPTRSVFKRYLLADTMSASPILKQKRKYVNTPISTKVDCKSPGYSTRIVQYNENQEKSLSHQHKYDKLGVFPIVHFFKKDLPHLKKKPNDTYSPLTVNSCSLTKYNSPEQNKMLLEKIIKSNTGKQCSPHKSENTKSVLDALKEISRKRIHSSGEEFIVKEDGKRIPVNYENESNSRKRLKQNSHGENSGVGNSSSKYASVDELMASHSSMNEYFSNNKKHGKLKENMNVEHKLTTIPVKHVDVETQTIPETTLIKESVDTEKTVDTNNTQQYKKIKKTSPVKIFDETPLEAMRKNRLSVLMGSLTSKQTSPHTDDTLKSGDKFASNKSLVSILSDSKKSPQKSNKHVTFQIPETASSPLITNSEDTFVPLNNTNLMKPVDGSQFITKTSAAMVVPIVSASVSESVPTQELPQTTGVNETSSQSPRNIVPISQNQICTPTAQVNVSSTPLTVFGGTQNVDQFFSANLTTEKEDKYVGSSNNKISGVEETSNKLLADVSIVKNFDTPFSNTGYKDSRYDIKIGKSQAVTETNTISGSNGLMTFTPPSCTTYSSNLSASVSTTRDNFSTVVIPMSMSNQQSLITSHDVSKPSNTFSFSFNQSQEKPTFSITTGTSPSSTFSFSSNKSQEKPTLSVTTGTSPASTFSFSVNKNQEQPTSLNTTGTTVSVSNAFSHSASPFVLKSPLISSVGSNIATSNFVPTSTVATTSSFTFGSNSTTVVVNPINPTFTPSATGSTAVSSLAFPKSLVPSSSNFGVQQNVSLASTFNKPNDSFAVSVSSPFAKSLTSNAFSFGPSNAGSFNQSSAHDKTMTGFGTDSTIKSNIPQNKETIFGTTSNFGANNNPVPSTNVAANTVNNIFGNAGNFTLQVPSQSSSSNFASSSFGQNQNAGFSGDLNSQAKNNSIFSFGTSQNTAFGTNTTASGFGSNTPSFSSPPPATLASSGNFSQTNNAFPPTFRATPFEKLPSSAETTKAEVSPFSATSSGFGSNSFPASSQVSQNNAFGFGCNTNSKSAVFSFGTSEPPVKSFNFQAESSPAAFGVGNKSFTSTPTFNSIQSPFNAQPSGAMFNIGAGGSSTVNRSRTQHKAKRRT